MEAKAENWIRVFMKIQAEYDELMVSEISLFQTGVIEVSRCSYPGDSYHCSELMTPWLEFHICFLLIPTRVDAVSFCSYLEDSLYFSIVARIGFENYIFL